jgi:cell division protein FtsZ
MRIAEESLMKIKDKVDVLVVISNDKIFSIINKDTSILKAFSAIDDVLKNAILGIVEIIAVPGIINLDFADIKSVVQDAGTAVVGVGIASGQNRAKLAVEAALTSPLLECSAEGAKGIVFGVSGGRDMKMTEIYEAAQRVSEIADPGARIIFGTYYDKKLKPGQMKITLIATGLNGGSTTTLFGQGIRSSLGLGLDKPKPTIEIFDKNKEKEEQDLSSNKLNFGKDIFSLVREKNKDKKEKVEDEKNSIPPKEDLEKQKREEKDDIWDTPAFLRRKKK